MKLVYCIREQKVLKGFCAVLVINQARKSLFPSLFTLDHRPFVCPPLLSCCFGCVQPPGPIALDHETSIHTSQNGSINKSPRWYLSEAWDLRLPLCLVEFCPAFLELPLCDLCASGGLGVLKSHLNHNPLRSRALLRGQCGVVGKKALQVLDW